ncbi:MAG: amidohydrolase family protein, partial [Chloroflexota bacterium]
MSGPSLPDRGRLLVRGGHVLTMDPGVADLPRGDVLVEDGVIRAVGTDLAAVAGDAEVIVAERMVVMPGMVGAHEHPWAALFRGVMGDRDGRDSWSTKERLAPHMDAAATEASVLLACAESIHAGVATIVDFAHDWMTPEEPAAHLRALVASGIRARFAPGAPSTKWGLSLDQMVAIMARVGLPVDQPMDLGVLADIQRQWFGAGRVDGRIRLGASVRGPARSTMGVVCTEFEGARALGLPIVMHCAGTRAEVARIHQLTVLDEAGLLGPDLSLAHGMQLTDHEIGRMGETGVALAVTPMSELHRELGQARLTELRAAGVVVGLGFDNPAYAASMDMFAQMRLALGLERARLGSEDVLGVGDVLRMATIDGARTAGLDDLCGSLTPGKRADLVLVRRDDLNMGPMGLAEELVVYAAQPANVDTVIADGRVLQRHGRLTHLDPGALLADATDAL